jgi:AraC-like DNA-binding protein/mannose-6-phosphate isomerase-like protein (cupin superfamily)
MNQFLLQQGISNELQLFSNIVEFALKKNYSIQLNSFPETMTDNIRIYYVIDGKFEWIINEQKHILYPGDVAMILPGQKFCAHGNFLDIGTLSWINIKIEKLELTGELIPGKWSTLSKNECLAIGKIFLLNKSIVLSKLKEAGILLQELHHELLNQQIGYSTRVNQLVDELFLLIVRKLIYQSSSYRDFPQAFLKLEKTLRQNLSHQWTVEEMASLVGLGTTSFAEKVKSYTGFSPLNYLITIRISEAIKLLKKQDLNVTDIALETGFYSSQHFSTTFKKLTGYSPSEFKKGNISKNQT